MADPLTAIASLTESVIGIFFDSPVVKAKKEEVKIRKIEAKAEADMTTLKQQGDYDTTAQANMATSWKDEYLIILHTFTIWGYGLGIDRVDKGLDKVWAKLDTAPMEWWLIYTGIIASTFGLRWLFSKKRVDAIVNR